MKSETLPISLYTFDRNNQKICHLSQIDNKDDTHKESSIWQSLLSRVEKEILPDLSKDEKVKYKFQLYTGELDLKVEQVILLFLKSQDLATGAFFHALANETLNVQQSAGEKKEADKKISLRPNVSPEDRLKRQSLTLYHPIITICYTDITTLNTEEKDKQGENERKWNELSYQSFKHDARIKFLDSSIWHRYVPIYPYEHPFDDVFKEVLTDIASYHYDGLYYTTSANVTLEFQMRMLLNSFIAKIGDRGHSEVVTPFKFHSEWQMKKKAQKEVNHFLAKKWNGSSLIEALKWQLLIVDDQAGEVDEDNKKRSKISVIDEAYKCEVSKKELILRPFVSIGVTASQINIDVSPKDNGIIEYATKKLRKKTYDILFLDYLLGYENDEEKKREYGFDFLMKLLEDNRKELPEFKRDFLGKYWIFPISSFPHALPDKLIQLGISHLHEIWHISQGGDPITTPHLYAYNLYRFIKQKIGELFLHPGVLKDLFNQVPITEENIKGRYWTGMLRQSLENWEKQMKMLDSMNFDASSHGLTWSMKTFLRTQKKTFFTDYLEKINSILNLLDKLESVEVEQDILVLLGKMEKMETYEYKQILEKFEIKVFKILYYNYYKAEQKIKQAIKNKKTHLSLENMNLFRIPNLIGEAIELETLNLNGNYLSVLPDEIKELKNLVSMDLSKNSFSVLPDLLQELNSLEKLSFRNNRIKLEYDEAIGRKEVIQLLKQYFDNQKIKNGDIKKHLMFLVAKNRLQEVLQQLGVEIGNTENKDLLSKITHLSYRYTSNEERKTSNTTKESEVRIEENRIVLSIISLINELPTP